MLRVMFLVVIVAFEFLSSFRVEAQPQLPPLRIVDMSSLSTSFPVRLTVDAAGNMYVIGVGGGVVGVFDAAGVHRFDIGSPGTGDGQFTGATDVAVSNDGSLYVADTGLPDNTNIRVQKFSAATGQFLGKFGEPGQLPGQFFNKIMSLAVDRAGNVYVGSVFQLQKFDANGNFLEAFELGGILPWAMGIDQDDTITFFEVDNGSFDKFNVTTHRRQDLPFVPSCNLSNGAGCIDPDGAGPLELGDGQLLGKPSAIAVDPSGNFYVADSGNARIQKFAPDGTFLWKFGSPGTGEGQFGLSPSGAGPQGIAIDAAGRIYVADTENQRIVVFGQAASARLSINNVTVTEGNTGTTQAMFTVTLTPASSQTVTVDFATADQSAQAGSDYTATQSTLTFAPGETAKMITVPVLGDYALESTERFVVQLSNPTNATLGSAAQGTGDIVNDDTSFARCQNVTVSTTVDACTATAASIDNGSTSPDGSPLTLMQTPAGPYPLGTTSVTLTATAGSLSDTCTATVTVRDQQAPTLTCPADQTVPPSSSAGAVVNYPAPQARDNCPTLMTSCTPPSGSTFPNGNTTVACRATDGAGLQQSCGFNVQVVADPLPELQIDDVSLAEGDNSQKGTPFTFTVTLSKPSTKSVAVQYVAADGTAERSRDYVGAGGVIIFGPGETSKTVTVRVIGESLPEADETFVVNLSNASGAVIRKGQGTGTILNDDGPRVRISDVVPNPRFAREGNSGMTTYTFDVTLSQPGSIPVTVQYATADGTASAGSDYIATNGTLTFQPGETRKTVMVNVAGDTTPEADETFTVNLSNASGGVIFKGQGTGTILNDDGSFVVISDASRAEGGNGQRLASTFIVTLSEVSSSPVTVQYATADGTAIVGVDYIPARGTLVFGPRETSKTITVNIVGEDIREPNEQFFVNLSNATGTTIVHGQGVGTILNDDGPTLEISDVNRAEGNSGITTYTFTVTLNGIGVSSSSFPVAYATVDGTATAGSDYTATSGRLTLTSTQRSQTITVNVLGDSVREPDETFTVNLSDAVGATIFKSQGIGTIANDD